MKRASRNIFTLSVWGRMIAPVQAAPAQSDLQHLTLDQFKRLIARGLDALLSTHTAIPTEELAGRPFLQQFHSLFRPGRFHADPTIRHSMARPLLVSKPPATDQVQTRYYITF